MSTIEFVSSMWPYERRFATLPDHDNVNSLITDTEQARRAIVAPRPTETPLRQLRPETLEECRLVDARERAREALAKARDKIAHWGGPRSEQAQTMDKAELALLEKWLAEAEETLKGAQARSRALENLP